MTIFLYNFIRYLFPEQAGCFRNGQQKNDKKNCQKSLTSNFFRASIMTNKVVILTRKQVRRERMPLYNHLKEYRAKINVNQHEMGKLVGVSRQTISQIERGDYSPSVTLALKIAQVFGVPVEEIFQYEEENDE